MKKNTTPETPVSSLPESVCPDSHREAIISMNNSLDIKSWNKGAERIYGIEKSEALDKSLASVVLFAFIGNNAGIFLNELSRNGEWQGEIMYIRKDRIVIFPHLSISAVKDPLGITIGYVAIVREVANKEVEHMPFRPVFDAEYRFVGLVKTDGSHSWQMVLHWEA